MINYEAPKNLILLCILFIAVLSGCSVKPYPDFTTEYRSRLNQFDSATKSLIPDEVATEIIASYAGRTWTKNPTFQDCYKKSKHQDQYSNLIIVSPKIQAYRSIGFFGGLFNSRTGEIEFRMLDIYTCGRSNAVTTIEEKAKKKIKKCVYLVSETYFVMSGDTDTYRGSGIYFSINKNKKRPMYKEICTNNSKDRDQLIEALITLGVDVAEYPK